MKASTTSTEKTAKTKTGGKTKQSPLSAWLQEHPKAEFVFWMLGFYGMLMILYLYFMLANLSSAPKYVYTAF